MNSSLTKSNDKNSVVCSLNSSQKSSIASETTSTVNYRILTAQILRLRNVKMICSINLCSFAGKAKGANQWREEPLECSLVSE